MRGDREIPKSMCKQNEVLLPLLIETPSARQPMSKAKEKSKIPDLQYAVNCNMDEMKSEVKNIHAMNEQTEELLWSLKNRLDQAEVSLVSFFPHPCIT